MGVEIFTKSDCMFCKKAKALFDEHGIVYEEIDVGTVKAFQNMQERLVGVTTVPQIIIDGHHIGGWDVLEKHQNAILKKYKSNMGETVKNVPLEGSETEKNLLKAFVGECVARMRYTFFASKAKKEGFVHISHVFEETADQEKAHASRLYKYLEGRDVQITDTFPAGGNGSTEENLRDAAGGEEHEHQEMYPGFAKTARLEGFDDIADTFEAIAIAERQHGKRFLELAENIKNAQVFEREHVEKWRCRNCGYVHSGKTAPDTCPACNHSKAYFELLGENW